jgi:hypothetical protein
VVDAIDHRGRLGEQLDFVPVLDLACCQHDLLAVNDVKTFFLQRVEHRCFRIVHTDRHVGHSGVLDQPGDFLGVFAHQSEIGRDRAAHADDAGPAMVRLEPVREFLVVHGRRAKVPDIRGIVACQQAEAAHLVTLPLTDLGR